MGTTCVRLSPIDDPSGKMQVLVVDAATGSMADLPGVDRAPLFSTVREAREAIETAGARLLLAHEIAPLYRIERVDGQPYGLGKILFPSEAAAWDRVTQREGLRVVAVEAEYA